MKRSVVLSSLLLLAVFAMVEAGYCPAKAAHACSEETSRHSAMFPCSDAAKQQLLPTCLLLTPPSVVLRPAPFDSTQAMVAVSPLGEFADTNAHPFLLFARSDTLRAPPALLTN